MKKLFRIILILTMGIFIYSCDELTTDPTDNTNGADMKYIEIIDLYAQGKLIFNEHMFDAENSKSYHISSYAAQKDAVDFIGYYTSSEGLSISSPDNIQLAGLQNYSGHITTETINGANHTDFKFISNTTSVFDNVENADDLISAYNSGTGSTMGKISGVKVNQIYGFRTDEGNYGILKILGLTGSQSDQSAIEISVKVQTNPV